MASAEGGNSDWAARVDSSHVRVLLIREEKEEREVERRGRVSEVVARVVALERRLLISSSVPIKGESE